MREDWKIVRLEKAGQVVNGGTPKTNVAEYWDGEHLWVTPAEMGNKQTPYLAESRRKLTDAGLKNSSASLVPPQSIILSTRAPIGHLVINTAPMAFNQGCRAVIPNPDMHYKYLFYFLLGNVELLNDLGTGTTFKELSATKLKNVSLPLPPLSEQKRIVAILDEAFAGIATAVANTEKNLANARKLFEGYLNSVFSQRGDEWVNKSVGEIAEHCLGKMLDKQKNKGLLRPYLRNLNVQWFCVDTSDMLEMRIEDKEVDRYRVEQGDLLICEGGYPGRAAIWQGSEPVFFQKAIHRVRCHEPVYNRWLLYFLYLADAKKELRSHFTGTGIQHFTGQALKKFRLPVPPPSTASDIVDRIDEFFQETLRLESIYHQKLTALAELKQSLLQKAFSGELTAEAEPIMEEVVA